MLPELGSSLLGLRARLAVAWIPNLETCNFLCTQSHLVQISWRDTFLALIFTCSRSINWCIFICSELVINTILCVTTSSFSHQCDWPLLNCSLQHGKLRKYADFLWQTMSKIPFQYPALYIGESFLQLKIPIFGSSCERALADLAWLSWWLELSRAELRQH